MTRHMGMALMVGTMLAAGAGCSSPAPAAPLPRTGAAAPVAPAAAAEPTPLCEVEIAGNLTAPPDVPAPMVFVALGDCLAEKPRVIGYGGSHKGRFFVEVFAPWGSDLTLCAASEPTPGAASRLYGKAAMVMHAEAKGEVEFKDVKLTLAPGPARAFPRP